MKGGQVWSQRISSNLSDSAVPPVQPNSSQPDSTDRTDSSLNDSRESIHPGDPRARHETSPPAGLGTGSALESVSLDWPAIQAFWEAVQRIGQQTDDSVVPLRLPPAQPAPAEVSRNHTPRWEAGAVIAAEPETQPCPLAWAVSAMALGALVPMCQHCGKPLNEEEPSARKRRRVS